MLSGGSAHPTEAPPRARPVLECKPRPEVHADVTLAAGGGEGGIERHTGRQVGGGLAVHLAEALLHAPYLGVVGAPDPQEAPARRRPLAVAAVEEDRRPGPDLAEILHAVRPRCADEPAPRE